MTEATAGSALPSSDVERRLQLARVLVEIGEQGRAEILVAEILEEHPEHLDALSLLAKIKHIRGELSLAVACAAQLHARRAGAEGVARLNLETMLHLAQDPERGAGEFLAVGQFQLVKKPTAYLALEEAFQALVARRPNEAREVCRRVAARERSSHPEVYKLAVLAEAWICELIGDLERACTILERLANERGFETDIDRVMALVAVYERIGTRERLEAALNIYQYLEHGHDPVHVLGRAALLLRRLGRQDEAASYERRHLDAYRMWMHRPTFADVIQVAARHYLPLEKLLSVRFTEQALPPTLSSRERAMASILEGRPSEGDRVLAEGADLLDLKYRANLASLDGAGEPGRDAVDLHATVLRKDPADLHVIGWLLDVHERFGSREVAELFRDETVASPALRALEQALQQSPSEARRWRQLASLFRLQPGGGTQAMEFSRRADALEQTAQDGPRASGRALAAAIYRFFGKSYGLIHEVWAMREPATPGQGGMLRRDDILGNLTDEMKDNVRNTFLAVRQYAQTKFPHSTRDILDYRYFYKVTKEDEKSGGVSAGLPTALAFLTVFLQRPMPRAVASTGDVLTEAHDVLSLRPVGDVEHKVDAAYHRNLRMLVVPAGNQPSLEQSGNVPREIVREIVRYAQNLDEAVRHVFGENAFV